MLHRRSNTSKLIRRIGVGVASLWLLSLVVVGISGVMAQPAVAASCGDAETSIISCNAAKSGTPEANDSANNPIIAVLKFVLTIMTGAVGVAAVGALIYAGILYSAASGEAGQVQKAKTIIKDTIIGIVAYGGMILILNFVIPGGPFGQQSTVGSGTSTSGDSSSKDSVKRKTPIVVATWNTLRFDNTRSNLYAGIKSIFSGGADVIGLQEVGYPSFDDTELSGLSKSISKSLSFSVGVYQPQKSGTHVNTPIVWNDKKYKLLSSSWKEIAGYGKYVTTVKLQNRETNDQLYVVNAHLQNAVNGKKASCSTTACNTYKKEMPQLVSIVKSLQASKLPIFLTGDFNINYRDDKSCTVSWWSCKALGAIDMQSGYKEFSLSGISSGASTIGTGSSLIDYVFFWKSQATAVSNKITSPNASCTTKNGQKHCWHGSDHKPLVLSAQIGEKTP